MATEKIQHCSLCQKIVDDVEPCKLRGRDVKIMVCPKCLGPDNFPNKVKVQWGSAYFQYYWDLGKSVYPVIPIVVRVKSTPRRQYVLDLTSHQSALLRAAGYVLSNMEVLNGSNPEIQEEDGEHSCIRGS